MIYDRFQTTVLCDGCIWGEVVEIKFCKKRFWTDYFISSISFLQSNTSVAAIVLIASFKTIRSDLFGLQGEVVENSFLINKKCAKIFFTLYYLDLTTKKKWEFNSTQMVKDFFSPLGSIYPYIGRSYKEYIYLQRRDWKKLIFFCWYYR